MPGDVITAHAATLISAPQDAIWEIATNPLLGHRWNPNISDVRDFSGMPVGVGTTWTQTVKILGRSNLLTARIVECDPPRFGIVQLTGPGNPRIITALTEESGHIRLDQTIEIEVPSGLLGIAMRMGRGQVQRELEEALRRQKASAEAEHVEAQDPGPRSPVPASAGERSALLAQTGTADDGAGDGQR